MTPPPPSKPINWEPRMRMRGGKVARYLGRCPITEKHRLQTSNKYVEWTDPKDTFTVWLVDDFGRCRGDLTPSNQDVVGVA